MIRHLAAAAFAVAATLSVAPSATAVEWQEPYGGCDEALAYPATAGFNQCALHDRINVRPCRYEDSDNCVWDARHRGNHRGTSYIVLHGTVTALRHAVAHALTDGDHR